MIGMYVYGIVEGAGPEALGLGIGGLDETSPVDVLSCQGLGCVVSAYTGGSLQGASREELVHRLLRHQQVVEHCMERGGVLPVKFGTVLEGPQEVRAVLCQEQGKLREALDSMGGRVEIEVAATWEIERVLQTLSGEEEMVRLRKVIASRGHPTMEEKIMVGQVAKACMDRRRQGFLQRTVDVLGPLAAGVMANPLVSDQMVLNVAFLVQESRQTELYARIQELDSLFQNEIDFRVIGPLPPYSFSTVEITRLDEKEIGEARQLLHVEDSLSEPAVRQAYRRLAAQEQGNWGSGQHPSIDRIARLRRAAELLAAFCRTGGAAWADGPLFEVAIKGVRNDEIDAARFGGSVGV